MKPQLLIAGLETQGIVLAVKDGKLAVRGPKKALTPAVVEEVRIYKEDIIRHLSRPPSPPAPPPSYAKLNELLIRQARRLDKVMRPGCMAWAMRHWPELGQQIDESLAAWEPADKWQEVKAGITPWPVYRRQIYSWAKLNLKAARYHKRKQGKDFIEI